MEVAASDRRFVTAVEAIYDAAPDPSRWPAALQAIADVFGDVGTVLVWQRDDGGMATIVSPGLIAAQREYEADGWYRRDLCAQRIFDGSLLLNRDAVTDHDAVSDSEMMTHPIYTEFFARHGLRWRAVVSIAPDPRISVVLAIQRSGKKQPHSPAELEVAIRLGRHAEKSLRLSVHMLNAELTNVGLGDALARVGIAIFALDSLDRVVFANPAAERLRADRHIEVVQDRLRIGFDSQRAFDLALSSALRGGSEGILAEPRPIRVERATERPLLVYILPVRSSGNPAQKFLTHTRAIVLVINPRADDPADPAVVRDVLGLTLGEARVAALIGSGLPPRETAEKLGIAEETARTTLKRVFSKVGVSRQSELVALLAKLVLR